MVKPQIIIATHLFLVSWKTDKCCCSCSHNKFYEILFQVGSKFLFIYQSSWQKRLLDKYGCMVLLDATYKTTLFDLPLFFLAVKTNIDYQIVGCFITEDETIFALSEALSILKERFLSVPEYFMTDNDDSEIVALETVFPGILSRLKNRN